MKESLRQKAIAKLKPLESDVETLPHDAVAILQELRIHQIELEMQNQELQQSQATLEKARLRYVALFDEAPVPYFVFNGQGEALEINHSAAKLLKIERHHMKHRPFFFYLDQGCRELFFQHLHKVLDEHREASLEATIFPTDGEPRYISMVSRPISGDEHTPCYCLTTCFDITPLKLTENKLIDALEKSQSANRAKDEFLSTMSHEFRTPLNVILGFTDLLGNSQLSPAEKGFLTHITNNGKQMVALVDDVLDIARMSADKIAILEEPCDLPTLLSSSLGYLEDTARRKGLQISSHVECPIILSDPSRIRQIVVNLLSNAVKFTKMGSIEILVHAEREDKESYRVTIEITDTGSGIKKEDMEKIFEPFTQGDSSLQRAYDGSGLGLTIAKRLAERLGGYIRLQSEITKGTKAIFSFVAKESLPQNAQQSAEGESPSKPLLDLNVLLLDTSSSSSELLGSLIKKTASGVTSFFTPLTAIDSVRLNEYSHVLINIAISPMSAVECMLQMRRVISKPTLFIALSKCAMVGEREKYLAQGFDRYITAPITQASLALVLDTHIPKL